MPLSPSGNQVLNNPLIPLSEPQTWVLSHSLPDVWMCYSCLWASHTFLPILLLFVCLSSVSVPLFSVSALPCPGQLLYSQLFLFFLFYFFKDGKIEFTQLPTSVTLVVLFQRARRREMFEEYQRQKHCFNLTIIRLRAKCTCNIFLRKYSWECSR